MLREIVYWSGPPLSEAGPLEATDRTEIRHRTLRGSLSVAEHLLRVTHRRPLHPVSLVPTPADHHQSRLGIVSLRQLATPVLLRNRPRAIHVTEEVYYPVLKEILDEYTALTAVRRNIGLML